MRRSLVLGLVFFPVLLSAQQAARTVSPGMNKEQVIAALGSPVTTRAANEFTYVFYKNTCGKACGMNDLVVLRSDSVVDAIFRSPDRHYTGTSSSPAPVPPRVAARKKSRDAGEPMAMPAKVRTKPAANTPPVPRMKPGPPNDTRPSIPSNEPLVRAAPPKKPAPKSP